MVGKLITPEENTLTLSIPGNMIGKKVKVIAFTLEEETEVIEGLAAELHAQETSIPIPQWHKDLVQVEKQRAAQNPGLLKSWDQVKEELSARKK